MEFTPVMSEKSFMLANEKNRYTFSVPLSSNKIEIAKAVEAKYKVTVESVNTITRPGKLMSDWRKNIRVRKSDRKKAIVLLKSGDKIDEFFNI